MKLSELEKAAAKAICRVQLNGGDPEQPAVRWNGTDMEPQEFSVWHDFRDEGAAAVEAVALPTMLELLEQAVCPNDCLDGVISRYEPFGAIPQAMPCQWCAKRKEILGVNDE